VTNLEYQVLAWLAAGNGVFRPRDATLQAEETFREVVVLLARLRTKGLLDYQDRHVMKGQSGIHLMVGPVKLTPEGKAELERDRQLGSRPSRLVESMPWRA
jgi:hypothetical protein